jgi:uncharacterized membrane protein
MATTTDAVTLNADRSPRDWMKLVSLVLTVIGIGIAGYLTYADVLNAPVACVQGGAWDCGGVQSSIYSRIGPVPVAVLGLIGYLAILLVLAFERSVPLFASRGKLFVFAMTLFGIVMSGYLTVIEAFVLHKWCIWCVGSALVMALMFILSFARLWKAISAIPEDEEESA